MGKVKTTEQLTEVKQSERIFKSLYTATVLPLPIEMILRYKIVVFIKSIRMTGPK